MVSNVGNMSQIAPFGIWNTIWTWAIQSSTYQLVRQKPYWITNAITFIFLARWSSALDKYRIKAWWDDLPMRVPLFWLSMDCIDYPWLFTIAALCEFHIVMNRDLAEGNEGVFTPPKQFLCRSHGVVDSGDEICQRVKEVDCTILPNDVTNPYCLKCGMSSHFESLSGCAQGSETGDHGDIRAASIR